MDVAVLFHFKALNSSQQLIIGDMEADDLDALLRHLQHRGLELLHVRRKRMRSPRPASRRDIIDFCFHIEHLLSAGIPLLDALNDLARHSESPRLRALCQRLASAISSGQSLSAALQAEPAPLEPAFIGIIRAGESSGRLPEILQRTGDHLKQAEELDAHTGQALLYPMLAGALVIAASIFLMRFLVPQIRLFLGETGLALPIHTQLLFIVTDFLEAWWPFVLGLPPAAILLFFMASRVSPWLRFHVDRYALKTPMIGLIRKQLLVARLADLLALLYSTGIPLLEALTSLQKCSPNRFVAQSLEKIRHAVEQGSSLAEAFAQHEIFPGLLIRMLQVGEKSGALDRSLNNVARLYEREARASIARLQTLIEPVLTLCIGMLLGWIMLSILQPIYGIIGQATP